MPWTAEHALKHWESEGLLDKSKAAELRKSLPAEDSIPNRAIRIFSALGAILVGLGVILFVASNWQYLSPLSKTLILVAGMLATGIVGYYYAYEKKSYQITGQALLFINAMVYGASIFLVAQIFHLPLNYWWGMLLWFIGTAFFAYVLHSKLHLWVSVPIFLFFIGWLRSTLATGFGEFSFLFDEKTNILGIMPAIGLGILSLGILSRGRRKMEFGEGTLFHWGMFLVLLTKGAFKTNKGRWSILILMAYIIFTHLIAWIPHWMGFDMAGYTGDYTAPMISALFYLHTLLVFVLLLTVTWYGTVLRMEGVINLGIVGLGFAVLIQYFSWAFETLDRSVAFIVGGIIILALSALLERQRRSLVSSIR